RRGRTARYDGVDFCVGQLERQCGKLLGARGIAAAVDEEVLPLNEAELTQLVEERCKIWSMPRLRVEHAQAIGPPRLLRESLRRRRQCRATEQRDELAAFHSITSSARASSVGGRVMPRAAAVSTFTTRSNLVGCSTGMSPGFAPRRILLT